MQVTKLGLFGTLKISKNFLPLFLFSKVIEDRYSSEKKIRGTMVLESNEKIIEARRAVARFKAGEIDLSQLFPKGYWTPLSEYEDLAEFVAGTYSIFSRIEAAAYANRTEDKRSDAKQRIMAYCDWAFMQKDAIQQRLQHLQEFAANSEMEGFGVLWVEEKLQWALSLFEAFKTLGY